MNAPQTIEVPATLPVANNLNIAEYTVILEYLGNGPHNKVGPLVQRMQAQAQQAVNDFVNPPPKAEAPTPLPPLPVDAVVYDAERSGPLPPDWYTQDLAGAREFLNVAERNRRSRDGTLPTTPGPADDPNTDYAAATILIGLGLSHLDEGLPNGQLDRVRPAFGALQYGVRALEAFIAKRLPKAD